MGGTRVNVKTPVDQIDIRESLLSPNKIAFLVKISGSFRTPSSENSSG